jgi:hypothetical protein
MFRITGPAPTKIKKIWKKKIWKKKKNLDSPTPSTSTMGPLKAKSAKVDIFCQENQTKISDFNLNGGLDDKNSL